MFRNLNEAWADLERGLRLQHNDAAAEKILGFGKEMFYLGAYSSLMMSNCIAKFTDDESEAVAQLGDLKKECTDYFGGIDPLLMHIEEIPDDPEDQFQTHDPDA